MSEALACLKKYFGYTSFREPQEQIIDHLMGGGDALVLMPTGGGKSLCYQLPALMLPGTTVVVSPLISLMRDQVNQLRANGICAAAMNSASTWGEQSYARHKLTTGELKLLYVSPERLLADLPWMSQSLNVSLFAIDEAHCISQWGHDFRTEYTQLGCLKETFPQTPIVALTATADRVTRDDILRQMNIPEARVFMSSFDRPNLSLTVRTASETRQRQRLVLDFVLAHPNECGIVYCLSRKNTESVASMLETHDISVAVYHAGLSNDERERAQQDFENDRVQVVCATVAFGMGINKSNVRFVVHYNLPKSIENYYQEIGRAGRDGVPSDTLLIYSLQDVVQVRRFAEESGQKEINLERMERMLEYAQNGVCRRRTLLNYFGQTMSHDCGNCDVCLHPPVRFVGTELVQKALSAVVRTQQKCTARALVDILRGSYTPEVRYKNWHLMPTFAVGSNVPGRDWRDYLSQMIQLGYLEIVYDEQNHLRVTPQGSEVLYGRAEAYLCRPAKDDRKSKRSKQVVKKTVRQPAGKIAPQSAEKTFRAGQPVLNASPVGERGEDEALFGVLRQLRMRLSKQQGLPPYIVFSDKVLHQLATDCPTTLEDFAAVSGIGEFKARKYGNVFCRAILDYLAENS